MLDSNVEKRLKQLEIFTDEEFNKAFKKVWDGLTKHAKPNQRQPVGIVTGGAPGSGKSAFIKEAMERFDKNIIAVNGDDFRVYHPRFNEIANLAKGDFPIYTGSFSGKMVEKVVEKAINDKYNLIVEGTFRTASTPIKTLQDMKAEGYVTTAKIKAVDMEVAWQSTIDRFNDMKAIGAEPRAVNRLSFTETANNLAENVQNVATSGVADHIEVWNRTEKLFDSRLGNINNLKPIINKELGIKLTAIMKPTMTK